jgi:hypothetical protein
VKTNRRDAAMLARLHRAGELDWAAARDEDDARRAANEARWAEEEAERQAESRRNYEEAYSGEQISPDFFDTCLAPARASASIGSEMWRSRFSVPQIFM